ncbi:MAG TPA: CvpA family protein [Pyrinomonadaceae bacterium]|nr:CvpA family protein [Pyrinomonadaceae bacterium]
MSFNWLDIVLVLVIAVSAATGWRRGFILSMLDLVRWIGSWMAALFFYRPVSSWLGIVTDWTETWRNPIAFILVAVLVSILIQVLGHALLRRIPREAHKRSINRIIGILPGLLSGFILAALLSALLFAMPFADGLSRAAEQSALANRFAGYTDEIESAFVPIFDPALRQSMNRLQTVEPGSNERVELPFKVEHAPPAPALETQMLELVNRERVAAGLNALEPDPELTEVARRHSADMFARGYFAHNTPEGKDPFDRMRESEVKFRTAGENLALAPTLQIAHTGLMNSPGHRANILRPQFGRVGIGILDGGRRGLMVSQEFRN